MKNKLKLLVCCLLVCVFVPINFAFAAHPIDRDADGVHIDDIVYDLSQNESLSSADIRDLLDLISPSIPSPTTDEVAAGITGVTAPAAGETGLTLPAVPNGYTIEINSSSNTEAIGTNGAILHSSAAASSDLIFKITRLSDGSIANTITITVVIPAYEPTAISRPTSSTNVALVSNVGFATASSTHGSFSISSVNNGERTGSSWGSVGGGWNDASPDAYPDWVEIEFNGSHTINEIDVFTLRDDIGNSSEPTIGLTFNSYGITGYQVQYWAAGEINDWVTVTNGTVKAEDRWFKWRSGS